MGAVRVRRKLMAEYRVGGNSMSEERKQDRLQPPVDAFVNSREAKSRVYTNTRFAVRNNENELSRYAIYPNTRACIQRIRFRKRYRAAFAAARRTTGTIGEACGRVRGGNGCI